MRLTRRQWSAMLAAAAIPMARAAETPEASLREGLRRSGIPAAAGMVADRQKVLWSGAYGTRDASGVALRTDAIFAIFSMTKAVTTMAALQLVEKGKLGLDEPVSNNLPELRSLQVLDGFGADGKPRLRPARSAVTLRHLLTHTSGFCYTMWDANLLRYGKTAGAARGVVPPLMFDPGTRWEYGTGLDWAGRLVEVASGMNLEDYFQANILRPLGMADTSFLVPAEKFERLVSSYQRLPNGRFAAGERKLPGKPRQFNGGGGLYSTMVDYVKFMQMILGKGQSLNGQRILSEPMVAQMSANQIGNLTAGKLKTAQPELSADVDMQPGQTEKWGLGFLINTTAYAGGRSAGSLAWAGLANTFYWIDPARNICAVLMMQYLPFVEKDAVGLLNDFEQATYRMLA